MITLNRWKDDNTNDPTNTVSRINGKNEEKNKGKNEEKKAKEKKEKKMMNKKAHKIGYHVLFLCGHQIVVFFNQLR